MYCKALLNRLASTICTKDLNQISRWESWTRFEDMHSCKVAIVTLLVQYRYCTVPWLSVPSQWGAYIRYCNIRPRPRYRPWQSTLLAQMRYQSSPKLVSVTEFPTSFNFGIKTYWRQGEGGSLLDFNGFQSKIETHCETMSSHQFQW